MVDLKELRNKAGLTQADLAEMVGVTENTIQNWESKKTFPKGEKLNQYFGALGIKSQAEMQKIMGEISVTFGSEEADIVDNLPYFLLLDSKYIERIKDCYATAEELDMLGYVEYLKPNGRYAKQEKRVETWFPLEFAFFEKYGGFNATMKKIADSERRLGKLYSDALCFAANNPGCDYRLISCKKTEIIGKLAVFLNKTNLQKDIKELYDMLKIIDACEVPSVMNDNKVRNEKMRRINEILLRNSNNSDMRLEILTGYAELKDNFTDGRPDVGMLRLTERGKQLIAWVEENNITR